MPDEARAAARFVRGVGALSISGVRSAERVVGQIGLAGDVIAALNGRLLSPAALPALRSALKQAAGTPVVLRLHDPAGSGRGATLVLCELVRTCRASDAAPKCSAEPMPL